MDRVSMCTALLQLPSILHTPTCAKQAYIVEINGGRHNTVTSMSRKTAHLSTPAQATMTPLSVHRCGGGHTSCMPASSATPARLALRDWLQATPPATTRLARSGLSSLAHAHALLHRCVK